MYGNHDPGACGLAHAAWALELLGESESASRHTQAAIALARTIGHRFSHAHALLYAARVHQLRGDWRTTLDHAEEAGSLANESGFVQLVAWANVMRGWALVETGESDVGMAALHTGLAAIEALGSKDFLSYFLALMAESQAKVGRSERALAVATEALAFVEASGERFYAAELHRLRGELLLAAGHDRAEVAKCFRTAVDIARHQGARTLEHRALASLRKLAGDSPAGTPG
jgi:predicted ATPase